MPPSRSGLRARFSGHLPSNTLFLLIHYFCKCRRSFPEKPSAGSCMTLRNGRFCINNVPQNVPKFPPLGPSELRYVSSWRQLEIVGDTRKKLIRNFCGHKSSRSLMFTSVKSRKLKQIPTKFTLILKSTEFVWLFVWIISS